MRCRDCLIWQGKRQSIASQMVCLVPECAKIEFLDKEVVSAQAKVLDAAWRRNEVFQDIECPAGRCIL